VPAGQETYSAAAVVEYLLSGNARESA